MSYSRSLLVFSALTLCTFLSCSEEDGSIDPSLPLQAVTFHHLQVEPSIFDTDTISITPGADKLPSDPVTLRLRITVSPTSAHGITIETVVCHIRIEGSSDDVVAVPLTGSTDAFTGDVLVPIKRGDVGDYRVVISGRDSRGAEISELVSKITVLFGSKPPVICGVTAPDTVDRPASGVVVLRFSACVSDPSGPQDIKRVLFNSFLPNGMPSTDNPFLMNKQGDGLYVLDVQLPSTAATGLYRFEYQAFDLSNLSSNVWRDTLIVR